MTRRKPENNHPSPRNLEVYAAVCEGAKTFEVIAEEFGISRGRVCHIRDSVERWMRPQLTGKIDVIREKQTQLLMHLFNEAMEEWERSKQVARKIDTERGVTEKGSKDITKKQRRWQCGDPRYLDSARQCLADIRKIWGANAQPEINSETTVNVQMNVLANAPPDERERRLSAIAEGLRLESVVGAPAEAQSGGRGEPVGQPQDAEGTGDGKPVRVCEASVVDRRAGD